MSFALAAQLKVERLLTTAVVDAALHAGFVLAVFDQDEAGKTLAFGRERTELLAALHLCDDEWLWLYPPGTTSIDQCHPAGVHFVYGSHGTDVISDYATSLGELLRPVVLLSDRIDEGKNWEIVTN